MRADAVPSIREKMIFLLWELAPHLLNGKSMRHFEKYMLASSCSVGEVGVVELVGEGAALSVVRLHQKDVPSNSLSNDRHFYSEFLRHTFRDGFAVGHHPGNLVTFVDMVTDNEHHPPVA